MRFKRGRTPQQLQDEVSELMGAFEAVMDELDSQLLEALEETLPSTSEDTEKIVHARVLMDDLMDANKVRQLVKDLVDPRG